MPRAWCLRSRPQGMPRDSDFALVAIESRPLDEGEIRIANSWLSVDPYMRGRMNEAKSYVPPFALGEPMQGGAIGEVIESRASSVPVGTKVQHMLGWRDEAALPADQVQKLPAIEVPDEAFLGLFGMPGMTAYFDCSTWRTPSRAMSSSCRQRRGRSDRRWCRSRRRKA